MPRTSRRPSVAEELALWFAARGHQVEAIAAAGTRAGESAAWWSREERRGIHIMRCPRRRAALPGGLSAELQHLSFALSSAPALLRRARRFRPSLIAAVDPAAAMLPALLLAARRARAPSWVHVSEEGPLASPWLRRVSHVSLAAVGAGRLLAAAGIGEAQRLPLPAWVDSRALYPLSESPAAREPRLPARRHHRALCRQPRGTPGGRAAGRGGAAAAGQWRRRLRARRARRLLADAGRGDA